MMKALTPYFVETLTCFIYVLPYFTLFDLIAALSVISPVHNIITITPIMTQNMLIPSTVSETKKMTV